MTRAPVLVVTGELAVMFAGSTLLTPLYEVYRSSFGFTELTLTLVYSVYVVGNVTALLFVGRLSDQIGRRRTTLAAILCAAISSMAYLGASSVGWLFAGRALSGLAIGVASGTAAAWLAELAGGDGARASTLAAMGNFVGIAIGPLLAGALAQYAPAPLRLGHAVYLAALVVTALAVTKVPETVPDRAGDRRLSLQPRIGVPAPLRARFVSPAATVFAAFALVGFYAALVPGVLRRDMQQDNLAAGGAVAATMFLAGAAGVWTTRSLPSRRATLGGLAALLVSLGLLVLAERAHSLPILLAGTLVGGAGAAVGYRGGLQVVNQIAPRERRAEVISSFLVAGFLGNALPVIGIGVLSRFTGPVTADLGFSAVIATLALMALVTGARLLPRGRARQG